MDYDLVVDPPEQNDAVKGHWLIKFGRLPRLEERA